MLRCVLITPSEVSSIVLRRYAGIPEGESRCPTSGFGYHNAEMIIERHLTKFNDDGYLADLSGTVPHDDPRWPNHCSCGYNFKSDDHWQVNQDVVYIRSDDGGEASLHRPFPGMMWYVPWYHNPSKPEEMARVAELRKQYPRGSVAKTYLSAHYWHDWSDKRPPLSVYCPNMVPWCIDSVSSNGTGWTVTGTAPLISAHPSISVSGYHGWLGVSGTPPGYFSGDLEGRRYENQGIR